jgi:hypothetical protein
MLARKVALPLGHVEHEARHPRGFLDQLGHVAELPRY